jgi:hypothetical protein
VRAFVNPVSRGFMAGLAGTAVMSATLKAEQIARRHSPGPVDYDASPHVVTAAAAVLHHNPCTAAGRTGTFVLVHWGYGSAVGIGYVGLRRLCRSRRLATLAFYAGCQAMAMTLFPTVGGTPPPWRWQQYILLSSLAQHAIYAGTVAAAESLLAERADRLVTTD